MKAQADIRRKDLEFIIRDWVFPWLQPYRRQIVILRKDQKLSPRYFGPFQVTKNSNHVAYKLVRPPNLKVHRIFHVSLLKPYHGPIPPPSLGTQFEQPKLILL